MYLVGFIIKKTEYVVYSCLIVSWLLAVQTSIAYDRIWILYVVLFVWSALGDCAWICVLLCMLVL